MLDGELNIELMNLEKVPPIHSLMCCNIGELFSSRTENFTTDKYVGNSVFAGLNKKMGFFFLKNYSKFNRTR